MTFMFGLVIVGNVVDNVSQPRWVILFLQISLGVCWVLTGTIVHFNETHFKDHSKESEFSHDIRLTYLNNLMVAQLLGSGVVIINILQVSNWFTQRHINKMLALFLMTQFAGYITPLEVNSHLYDSVQPTVYWVCGGVMLLISIVDKYSFAFHPLQKNIFLDQEDQLIGEEEKQKESNEGQETASSSLHDSHRSTTEQN